MNVKERNTVLVGVLVCALLAAASWFLLISPKRSDAATAVAQTQQQLAANTQLQGQITQLQQQAAGLVAKQADLQKVAARIPSDPQFPALVTALEDIHDRTGVDITGITPGTPVAPVAPVAAVVAPVAAAPTTSASAGTATTTTTTPATAAGSTGTATYSIIPVTTIVVGDYAQTTLFLDEIERLQRLYLVTGVVIAATPAKPGTAAVNPDGSALTKHTLTATVTGEVFTTSAATTTASLPALAGAGKGTAAGTATAAPGAPAVSPAATN